MNETVYDVIIIGGGPAGLTAAIYTSRASLKTLILAGQPAGGQLTLTSEVENFPGFPDGIMGPELIGLMQKQAIKFGAEYVEENAAKITGSAEKGFSVVSGSGNEYKAKTIIVASGASAKWLPLESVQRLRGKGVSACATCDGFFFKGKVVAVVGGGDSAMEEALFLTKFSPKVYVLTRGGKDSLKASKIMLKRAQENEKIEFVFDTEVLEVIGENAVSGIKIKNTQSGEEKVFDDVKGLFMAIGHKPNTDFLAGLVDLGPLGYVVPVDNTKTNVEGIFVAGDVGDWKYRQAVSAAGFGCVAALDVEKYLAGKE
uniref:Thioredoxin reductase n=1 Tax=candidate division WWE3 bacterium TaxID=2053526 RepID=A0A7C4XGB4_UNCKA